MSDHAPVDDEVEDDPLEDVPDWDDEYIDRVSDRILHSYDLERNRRVEGQQFTLYGSLEVERRKAFIHPSLTYGNHNITEHLFVRRADAVAVRDFEQLVDLGETLSEEWIDADEEHYQTEFVFGLVVPEIPDDVREFVSGFESRNLINYGYYGHYNIRLFVVAPDTEDAVASPETDVVRAFRLWDNSEREEKSDGVLGRLRAAFSRRS